MMEFTAFNYLTDLEKRKVRLTFKGWKRGYLESLKFKKMEDGWAVRDESLRATQYMHVIKNLN